jgi:hypothetical protein
MSRLQAGDEFFDREAGLLDDILQRTLWQGLVAMHRDTDRADRRTIVKQNMVTSASAIDLEAKSQENSHGVLPGNRRQTFPTHGQAAMVK